MANDHVAEHLEGGESDSGVWKGQVPKAQGKERKGKEGRGAGGGIMIVCSLADLLALAVTTEQTIQMQLVGVPGSCHGIELFLCKMSSPRSNELQLTACYGYKRWSFAHIPADKPLWFTEEVSPNSPPCLCLSFGNS